MSTAAAKPPPIRVGVEGIAPRPQATAAPAIDWPRLRELPPFQMFAAEVGGMPIGEVNNWLPSFLERAGADLGEVGLFDTYSHWHAKKGLWPAEDPMGRLKK